MSPVSAFSSTVAAVLFYAYHLTCVLYVRGQVRVPSVYARRRGHGDCSQAELNGRHRHAARPDRHGHGPAHRLGAAHLRATGQYTSGLCVPLVSTRGACCQ